MYPSCFSLRSPKNLSSRTSVKPIIELSGVRNSCDILAKKTDFALLAFKAWNLASSASARLKTRSALEASSSAFASSNAKVLSFTIVSKLIAYLSNSNNISALFTARATVPANDTAVSSSSGVKLSSVKLLAK